MMIPPAYFALPWILLAPVQTPVQAPQQKTCLLLCFMDFKGGLQNVSTIELSEAARGTNHFLMKVLQ